MPAPAPELPRYVMLELTNACDLRCRHCPYHGDLVQKQRPVGRMPEAIWRAALAEIGGWQVDVEFQPWGMGEPLLAPALWDVVAAAKSWPRLNVGFYSNGNAWRDADVEAALVTDLDWVTFSLDGVRQEVFEHYRVGARLERVLGTVRALAAARRRRGRKTPVIQVNMVEYPELVDHAPEFLAAMRGLVDGVMISRFRAVGDRRFSPVTMPRRPCYQLDTMLAMAWDGRIVQCCEDQQGQQPVGWFPAQSLREVWYGERLGALRAAHRAGRHGLSPLCVDCDGWTGEFERERRQPGMRVRERTATTVYEFEA